MTVRKTYMEKFSYKIKILITKSTLNPSNKKLKKLNNINFTHKTHLSANSKEIIIPSRNSYKAYNQPPRQELLAKTFQIQLKP